MTPFEYLLTFAAVILGLAVSELAVKCHRLVDLGAQVRWDWLSPLAGVCVLLKIITQWWAWYAAQSLAGGLQYEMFICVIIGGVLLFLLASTALPETSQQGEVDLALYYERVRRRFWLLFTAHWIVATFVGTWAQIVIGGARFSGFSLIYLIAPFALSLAFIRLRWFHGIALIALSALYATQFLGQQLGGV